MACVHVAEYFGTVTLPTVTALPAPRPEAVTSPAAPHPTVEVPVKVVASRTEEVTPATAATGMRLSTQHKMPPRPPHIPQQHAVAAEAATHTAIPHSAVAVNSNMGDARSHVQHTQGHPRRFPGLLDE